MPHSYDIKDFLTKDEAYKTFNTKESSKLLLEVAVNPITAHLTRQDEDNRDVKVTLDAILSQVKRTNGRVTFLEKIYYGLSMCAGLMVVIVVPLIAYMYVHDQSNLQSEISTLQNVKDNLSAAVTATQ